MNRILSTALLAIAVGLQGLLPPATAHAQSQASQIRNTFYTLQQAAASMNQGDMNATIATLAGMRDSVAQLEQSFARHRAAAEAAAGPMLAQIQDLNQQVAAAWQAEQTQEARAREISGKAYALTLRSIALNKRRDELQKQIEPLMKHQQLRHWCLRQPMWGMFEAKCLSPEFANDITGRGVVAAIQDIELQQAEIGRETTATNAALFAANADVNRAQAERARQEALRVQASRKEGDVRLLLVNLKDAVDFLADLQILTQYRLEYPAQEFQERLLKLLARAAKKGAVPALGGREVQAAESLQASLQQMASMMDDKAGLLAMIERGGLTCPPTPRNVQDVPWSVAADYRDWTHYRGATFDVIGAARCVSPDAFYYGTVPDVAACETKCKRDAACVMWTFEEKPETGQCWGASSAVTPSWKMEMVRSTRSGGRKYLRDIN